MCRLLGVVTDGPVDLEMTLADAPDQLARRGHSNPDGFGVGCFEGGAPVLRKHDLPPAGPPAAGAEGARGTSETFVAHVRRASRAPRAIKNCHPFQHEGWIFAHNGALFPLLEKWVRGQVGRVTYEGQTDSEAVFRWVLKNVGERGSVEQGVQAAVEPLIADGQFSSLNFLLARPGEIHAFRHATRSASYFAMWYLDRPAGNEFDAISADVFSRVHSRGLRDRRAWLVASEKLGSGDWQALELGCLLTVRAGQGPRVIRIA